MLWIDGTMGNVIYLEGQPEHTALSMGNGLTDTLISALLLSGSQLAKTDHEKRLIVWLAEKDQSAVGMGTVGFSVLDMPWDRNTLEQNRSFLRRTVEQAKMRRGWELLDYQPSEELLLPSLEKFLFLIAQLKQADIQPDCLEAWLAEAAENDPVRCGFPRCPKHHTLLTVFGCQICTHGSFG